MVRSTSAEARDDLLGALVEPIAPGMLQLCSRLLVWFLARSAKYVQQASCIELKPPHALMQAPGLA
jgi:hypothetical protein